ncbi:cation diffusion facilitator family transporter [Bacillaceae bacterium S4-13-58]
MEDYSNLKRSEKGAWVSIGAYIFLSFIKISVAFIGNSEALKADGLNNMTDIIASIAVLIGLRISRKPPDQNHHYGHMRAETISSLVAAFIMITVGLQVIWDTLQSIFSGQGEQPSMITAWTALFSAFAMFGVYFFNLNLSKKVKSHSLKAVAQDNRSDALVSIGAFVGIIGAQFGAFWLDPAAGLIVGIIISKTAWDIFSDATHMLTDGFDIDQLLAIKNEISKDKGVMMVGDCKARVHGNHVLLEATIHVDPSLSVQESHEIADRIELHLKKEYEIHHSHIHIEPYSKTTT